MIDVNKINNYALYLGDYLQVIKEIPDSSIDLILTDPPYNLAQYSTGNLKFDWRADRNNDVAEWDLVDLDPNNLVDEFKRILKPKGNIFVFCSYNLIGEYHKAFDPVFDTFQFMVWHKTNPVPNFRKTSFLNSCELIIACWNKGHTWNFTNQKDMHNFVECGICMGNERIKDSSGKNLHPTQKPISILKKIISIASNENDLILDCFNGVGSTGEAALRLNRRYIGIEIEKQYVEVSKKRLDNLKKLGGSIDGSFNEMARRLR